MYLPGEEIIVQVIKDGKEHGQGVAYLDDGTMIVVEGGREYIGMTMEVLVTSVLQSLRRSNDLCEAEVVGKSVVTRYDNTTSMIVPIWL